MFPQATIAKIEGFARGGGHEFALACDMRFAARGIARFMQMEVRMGIIALRRRNISVGASSWPWSGT